MFILLGLVRRLLRLEAPDVRPRLQLRNVLGVLVALIATSVGLRGLGDGRLVLLRRALAGLEEHVLFLYGVGDLRRLAGEVEVFPRRARAEGIVVEGVVGVVELIAEAVIRLFEVDATQPLIPSSGVVAAQHTHHRRLPLHYQDPQKRRAVQSRGRSRNGRGPSAGWRRSQRTTWWAEPVAGVLVGKVSTAVVLFCPVPR